MQKKYSVLNKQVKWEDLYFYQKSEVVYQLAFVFCERFIHLYKDRTRDQVIQAARSCKQNIVEGLADGVTSTEMQLKLLNVARASLKELKEDFRDYLISRKLKFFGEASDLKGARDSSSSSDSRNSSSSRSSRYYDGNVARYDAMLNFCRRHNQLADYEPFFATWSDEEMCNYGLTLCHMIDKMMMTFMESLEQDFIENGGIKERMHKARTGYRKDQDDRLRQLEAENQHLSALCKQWEAKYEDLKQRALKAYNAQQEEIARLKARR